MGVKCFMVEKSGLVHVGLRRYADSEKKGKCSRPDWTYHDYTVPVGLYKTEEVYDKVEYEEKDGPPDFYYRLKDAWEKLKVTHELPENGQWPTGINWWPTACPCGYQFQEDDHWQIFVEWDYTDRETKQQHWQQRQLPGGAMWYEDWLPKNMYWDNQVGPHLAVMLPNGREWNIDSRASNCTLPNDRTHRCWVRTGEPPMVTAGKNGPTCAAGAGSILAGSYHGFLINGELVSC